MLAYRFISGTSSLRTELRRICPTWMGQNGCQRSYCCNGLRGYSRDKYRCAYYNKIYRWCSNLHARFQHQLLSSTMKMPGNGAVKAFFTRHSLPYVDGHATLNITCPNSCQHAAKNVKCVYVNKVTGSLACSQCNKKGQWQDTTEWYSGKRKMLEEDVAEGYTPKDIAYEWTNCQPFEECQKNAKIELMKKYGIQALKEESLKKFNIRVKNLMYGTCEEEKHYLVCPWFDFSKAICGIKVLLPERTDLPSLQTLPKNCNMGLFGYEHLNEKDTELILTSNEFDAIAINQTTGKPVVTLPNGNLSLPIDIVPLFEQFKRITIWLGNSVKDKQMGMHFANKLKKDRCFFLESVLRGEVPTPLEAVSRGMNLEEILHAARSVAHNRIVTFHELRSEVYNEFANIEQISGVKWQRHPELTDILKGHRRGELTVFTGRTGSGKTTLISELSIDLCQQGVNTLFGSFEIRNVRMMKTMLKQFAGMNFEDPSSLVQFERFAEQFERLPLYFMEFYGAQDIHEVIQTMEHAAYVFDIEHIVIDNLQFLLNTDSRDEKSFREQNLALSLFRKFASQRNVHVTLVMHPRKEDDGADLQIASIGGSAKASQEADNVLILQSGKYKGKSLQIVKNRFDGDLRSYKLKFSKEHQCMGSQSLKFTAKVAGSSGEESSKVSRNVKKWRTVAGASSEENSKASRNVKKSSTVAGASSEESSNISRNVKNPSTVAGASSEESSKGSRNVKKSSNNKRTIKVS